MRIFADGGDGFEEPGRCGAGFQAALRRELIDQPIRQRIAEGHAQFQNRHARPVKGQGQFARGGEMRVAGADVNNQPFFAGAFERGEFFHNAIHVRESFPFQL